MKLKLKSSSRVEKFGKTKRWKPKKQRSTKKFQSNLNSLTEKTLEQEQKMKEDFDFFFNNNASQPKKKVRDEKK